MASTYIQRVDSTDGNRKVWTWSAWVKRDVLGSVDHNMFSMGEASADEGQFKFSSDQLSFFNDYASSGRVSASQPSRKFRDVNGWYHFVWRHKSDESTASDRWKIYINGERLDPSDYGNPSIPNEDGCYNKWSNKDMWFGARAKAQNDNSYQYFSGLMSHIHFCDGYAYDASDFGSTDSTTGEWKINTSPNVQYGSKGFFILKDGNSVTDQSGNGNNCTVGGGTLTKTEDNPSNVFATGNPLAIKNSPIFTNGNNTITALGSSPYDVTTLGTLGMSSGKFYYEVKWRYGGNQSNQAFTTGITASNQPLATNMSSGSYNNVWFNLNGGDLKKNNSDVGTDYPISVNSIVGFAWDLDNGTLKIHENGTYKNSGNAVVTGIPSDTYLPFFSPNGGTTTSICDLNFGNGYFGTTAVSSAGTNASGIGIFEYDVPTGYTALSTKGLNL
jgi:hypothetical protein